MNRVFVGLFRPVDGASLAAFRAFVGFVMLLEAADLLRPFLSAARSPIVAQFRPETAGWLPKYFGFEWLEPLGPSGMRGVGFALAASSFCLMIGYFSRLAAAGVFLTWTYLFLLDATRQNNHYYLMSLIALLLVTMPAGRCGSVDRWMRGGHDATPQIPFWPVFLLRAQLFLVYFFGGVAKLSIDWLRDAEPVGLVLSNPDAVAPFRAYFSTDTVAALHKILATKEAAYFFSYGGLLFDLAIGPLLLINRTRLFGMVLMLAFHSLNHALLFDNIGWFPLFATLTATIFLSPRWPRNVAAWCRRPYWREPDWGWLVSGMLLVPGLGAALGWKLANKENAESARWQPKPWSLARLTVVAFVTSWLLVQTVVPLRHWFIEGDVNWTAEGDLFAWRMKAASRRPGALKILVRDSQLVAPGPDGEPDVNWEHWDGDRAVYHEVNGESIDWQSMPQRVTVYQPLVGERLVFNGAADGDQAAATSLEDRVVADWHERFGRKPVVRPFLSLPQFVDALSQFAKARYETNPASAALLTQLTQIKQCFAGGQTESSYEQALDELRLIVSRFYAEGGHAARIRRMLTDLCPFALEGFRGDANRLLLVHDGAVGRRDASGIQRIDRDRWWTDVGKPPHVYTDMQRLGVPGWQALPALLLIDHDEHGLVALANPYSDMSPRTARIVAARPYLIHQYIQRVATEWAKDNGRRPEVYVDVLLALNRHPMQRLIDPTTDLAATPLRRWSHNEWILPRETPSQTVDERTAKFIEVRSRQVQVEVRTVASFRGESSFVGHCE